MSTGATVARGLTQWYSKDPKLKIDGVLLQTARAEEARAKQLADNCLELIRQPGFAKDIPSQLHVVGFLLNFGELWKVICEALHEPFIEATGIQPERFKHLLTIPWDPEIETRIRDALKATRCTGREPLAGEDIYPRVNWLGQYLNYMEGAEAPLAFHFWCGCALLGAACRRNVYFQWRYHLFPNYYLFLVGPSALGKGMAIDRTSPLVHLANERWEEGMAPLINVNGPYKGGEWPNKQIVVLPSKVTPQDIIKSMVPAAQDKQIYPFGREEEPNAYVKLKGGDSVSWLANGEASSILQRRDSLADGCIKLWTDGYNCEEIGRGAGTIVRGHEQLERECFNIILGSTLEWINTSISTDMMNSGFVRRLLFVYRDGDAVKPEYDDEPPPILDPLQATILSLQMSLWMGMQGTLEVEPDEGGLKAVGDLRRKWREECRNPSTYKMLPYYIGKFNAVMKTAIVLTVNSYTWPGLTDTEIESMPRLVLKAEYVQQALFLVEHEESYMKECFARMGEHRTASDEAHALGVIHDYGRQHKKPIGRTQLRGQCTNLGTFDSTLKSLINNYGIREGFLAAKGGKGGRKATCYWDPEQLPDWGEE